MNKKVKWGILSTAKIGREKVIPALLKSTNCEVIAIASRTLENAQKTASDFNIKKVYGSYEELLNDPGIDAIYNPLPNHLHLKYTLAAIKAGKHVLCEKPIGMNAQEAAILLQEAAFYPQLKVMEALMYKFHPQWLKVKEWVDEGKIGKVKNIQTFFSYHNIDANNIRNIAEVGGGALMDIGCYCISFPRFILQQEPAEVLGSQIIDPLSKTDYLTSGTLFFKDDVTANFTCSTKLFPYQRTQILGNEGRIEIDFPCNAPLNEPTKITIYTTAAEEILHFTANQYVLQCEAFANAIINNTAVPFTIKDAFLNMKVLDKIRENTSNSYRN